MVMDLLFARPTAGFAGILGGGALGVREGFQKAPNRRARVLMNSIMNAAGKRGSIYGNTFAVLGEKTMRASLPSPVFCPVLL